MRPWDELLQVRWVYSAKIPPSKLPAVILSQADETSSFWELQAAYLVQTRLCPPRNRAQRHRNVKKRPGPRPAGSIQISWVLKSS